MRMIALVSVLCFLWLNATAAAEESTSVYENKRWGFSCKFEGLTEATGGLGGMNAFRAETAKRNSLEIECITTTDGGKAYIQNIYDGFGKRGCKRSKLEECSIGNKPALRFTASEGDNSTYLYWCTKSEPKEQFWLLLGHVGGKPNPDEAKIHEAAVESFALLKEGEKPEASSEKHVDTRIGFQISTKGYSGKIKGFTYGTFVNRVLEVDGTVVGLVAIGAQELDKTPKEAIENWRSFAKTIGQKILEEKELKLFGRDAVKWAVEEQKANPRRVVEETLIWDNDLIWELTVRYESENSKGKEALLRDAANSFTLLKPLTVTGEKKGN